MIHFDLDGVLADYCKHFTHKTGLDVNTLNRKDRYIALAPHLDTFFIDLPVMALGMDILQYCIDKKYPIGILSSAGSTHFDTIQHQKRIWIKNHIPIDLPVILTKTSKEKAQYVEKSVLIDDRDEAILPFRCAGGMALKFTNTPQNTVNIKNAITDFMSSTHCQ